ncbi:hypothetical protein L3Y34_015911 [Caenorhabditis briggsae]|uniref:C2H2-type domain-containing protein n=1 Tax=Caenorhabditis briggsae TaxID=6238 RepID=A0AAE9DXX9_CAEBR|nr:hypothetical protein L3Y34_015911 [Caenorhabditis briggsae]
MSDDEEGRLRIDEGDSNTEEIKPQPRAPPLLPGVVVSKPPLDFPSSSNATETKDKDVSGKEDGELDEDDEEDEEQQEEEEEEEEREEDDEEMDTDDTEPKLTIVEDPDELMEVSKTPEPPKVQKKEEVPVKIEEEKEDIVMSEPSSPDSSKQSDEPEIKKEEPLDEQDITIETDTNKATTPDEAPQLSPAPNLKNENGLMKPPQSTEKAPRKRKVSESADNFSNDKRNIPSSSDTPRSKRSSSQYAKLAISACLADEDIVSLPMMPIQTPPQTKRAKRDVSTSVITTRSTDIDGLINDESILSTPPGTQLLLEITVMYRTRSSLAFRIKGCEMIGFIGDGLSPIISAVAANTASTSGNNNNKKKVNNSSNNEEGKDGRSSSASSNGRSARGGSVLKDGKADKQKGKKKKEDPSNEDIDEESQSVDNSGYDKCELKEVDVTQYHDCHYEGCEKRFQQSQELDYHISKYHKKRVMIYESICTQTEISSISTQDVGTETDDLSAMPVLKKEVPIKQPTYEDLSDDDMDSKPAELALKVPSTSSAAAALMGIAQQTASATPVVQRSTPSTPISAKIGINPQMIALAEKSKQQQQQQQKMVASSPRPNQHPVSAIPSTSAQPPVLIQTHPMGGHQFIAPGFHPGLIHHQNHMAALAAAMDPRIVAISQQQQQQQMARTPSRQSGTDSHKIHELAKTKENEHRQRQQSATPKTPAGSGPAQGAVTPQRPFIPPQMMQAPPGTPQSVQQQQQQQQAAQQQAQQQNLAAQQQLLQMQLRGMVPQMPNQQEQQLLMMMMGLGGMPIPGAVPGAPGFPQQQQPPK